MIDTTVFGAKRLFFASCKKAYVRWTGKKRFLCAMGGVGYLCSVYSVALSIVRMGLGTGRFDLSIGVIYSCCLIWVFLYGWDEKKMWVEAVGKKTFYV